MQTTRHYTYQALRWDGYPFRTIHWDTGSDHHPPALKGLKGPQLTGRVFEPLTRLVYCGPIAQRLRYHTQFRTRSLFRRLGRLAIRRSRSLRLGVVRELDSPRDLLNRLRKVAYRLIDGDTLGLTTLWRSVRGPGRRFRHSEVGWCRYLLAEMLEEWTEKSWPIVGRPTPARLLPLFGRSTGLSPRLPTRRRFYSEPLAFDSFCESLEAVTRPQLDFELARGRRGLYPDCFNALFGLCQTLDPRHPTSARFVYSLHAATVYRAPQPR